MSEKEVAVWQNQGNRTVRATPTDTAGDVVGIVGCLGLLFLLILSLAVWYLVLLIVWPW